MVLAIRIKLTVNERSCHSADYFHPGCYASHYLGQFSVKVKGEKKGVASRKGSARNIQTLYIQTLYSVDGSSQIGEWANIVKKGRFVRIPLQSG